MDTSKKNNEGEMGSGDSDDEFYNVKVLTAPDVASNKSYKKSEVKKVYSPPRTKVQYDYKFDSSSEDELESKNSEKCSKLMKEESEKHSEKPKEKKEEPMNDGTKLPESTFKVFEKINEELKNMNQGTQENTELSGTQAPTSVQSGINMPLPPKSVIPPVVVVPPQMVVPQASLMGPMIVPSMGMRGPVMLPSQNLMMGHSAMGLAGNSMMGMPGMMGMQGNIMGMAGGMIMPTMGGLNMGLPGNMLRMPTSPLLRMQGAGSNVMGITTSSSNLRPATVPPPPPPNLLMNNQVMANPGLVVMGGMMNSSITSTNQTTQGNFMSNNVVRLVNTPQGSLPVRVPPPPPFLNFRGRPPIPPGNFRWPTNSKPQNTLAKTGSPTSSSPSATSPESSPLDQSRDCDGEDLARDDKDKSPPNDSDESDSPPRELPNTFKNDGSFMEMFKKMREESENNQETPSSNDKAGESEGNDSSSALKKPTVMISGIVGKRRGGRVLKTGLVKKVKKGGDGDEEEHPKDAWSMYMAEVKKYREASCEEEGKTRPLVK